MMMKSKFVKRLCEVLSFLMAVSTPVISAEQSEAAPTGASSDRAPKLIAWFTMKAEQWTPEALDKMAAFHISGFDVENKYKGMMDDVRRGVNRMPQAERDTLAAKMRKMVTYAKSKGITELTWRLNGCSNNGDGTSGWDVWNEAHVTQIEKNMADMAKWAKDLGFKGLFIDYEIYTANNIWNAANEKGSIGSTKTVAENAERYFEVGRRMMQAMINVWPDQTFMVAPGLREGGNPGKSYKHYYDFFAGMVAADADNPKGPGIVTIDEPSMYSHKPKVIQCLYAYTFGLNNISGNQKQNENWVPVKKIFHDRDAANGNTKLWDYYQNKHETAMGMWPINVNGTPRCSLNEWETWLRTIHDLSKPKRPKYAWVYDQVPRGDGRGSYFMDHVGKAHGEIISKVFAPLKTDRLLEPTRK